MSLFTWLVIGCTLLTAPLAAVMADDAGSGQTNLSADPNGGTATGGPSGQGERGGRWREAFSQLNLTDAQQEQIKQIRANTQPGKERRQQVMAVLTPEQKEKLKELMQQYRSEKQAGGSTTATPGAN